VTENYRLPLVKEIISKTKLIQKLKKLHQISPNYRNLHFLCMSGSIRLTLLV